MISLHLFTRIENTIHKTADMEITSLKYVIPFTKVHSVKIVMSNWNTLKTKNASENAHNSEDRTATKRTRTVTTQISTFRFIIIFFNVNCYLHFHSIIARQLVHPCNQGETRLVNAATFTLVLRIHQELLGRHQLLLGITHNSRIVSLHRLSRSHSHSCISYCKNVSSTRYCP